MTTHKQRDLRPEAALAELRQGIDEVKAAIIRTTEAPVPFDEAAARLRHHLDRIAEGGGFLTAALTRMLCGAAPPNQRDLGRALPATSGDMLPGFLVALFRDRIEAWATDALRANDAGTGLAADKREERLAELRAALRGLELDEERLILAAEADGVTLDRRPDCDLEVFLTTFE
jgi:hypothetical protein